MMTSTKDYIRGIAKMMKDSQQGKLYKYLLDNGRQFRIVNKQKSLELQERNMSKLKECYYNAQMLILHSGLKYFEGFANAANLIPVDHAWLIEHGRVVEVTWRDFSSPDYFGIEIPKKFVMSSIDKTGTAEQLLWKFIDTKMGQ